MTAIVLTPAQRKVHRAAAHHLDPVVIVGADGLSDAVVREVDSALRAHELIKVRVFADDRAARESMLAQLSERLDAAAIQHIGKLLVLWRPAPPKTLTRDEAAGPGPKLVKIIKFSKSGNHRAQVKTVRVLGNERVTAGGSIKRAKVRQRSSKKAAAG
jgi:putative YhbY family RNA-binding protein